MNKLILIVSLLILSFTGYSQNTRPRVDTCLTVEYLASLKLHVSRLITYNELLIEEAELKSEVIFEKNIQLDLSKELLANERIAREIAEQLAHNINNKLRKADRRIQRMKKNRWLWTSIGAVATGTLIKILLP